MEERATGGKEKKYVLYTVVNDDKSKTGLGVWVVRILLGTLLLVALAVVPYVSLRLAQTNEKTLVVFQPFPVHNRTHGHHYKPGEPNLGAAVHGSSLKKGVHTTGGSLQSASLVRENYTSFNGNDNDKVQNKNGTIKGAMIVQNETVVTIHESAVTLAILEDSSNETVANSGINNSKSEDDSFTKKDVSSAPSDIKIGVISEEKKDMSLINASKVSGNESSSSNISTVYLANSLMSSTHNLKVQEVSEHLTQKKLDDDLPDESINVSLASTVSSSSILVEALIKGSTTTRIPSLTATSTSSAKPATSTATTSRPVQKYISTKKLRVAHKLAYVATASSGNHVGGLCIWKTNKNVTDWSFFYDNIPIEFQSRLDNTDHEMRAILAAVRLWSDKWYDYHVVIRSHHPSIKGSKHPTRVQVTKELDDKSEDHFTYELEYRLGRDDTLVKIAYSLARLHKNFEYWFKEFENNVDEILGKQNWSTARTLKHAMVQQELFITDTKPQREEELGDLNTLAFD